MKIFRHPYQTTIFTVILACWVSDPITTAASNAEPEVSIVWPHNGDAFRAGTYIKIKVNAADPDGSITQVKFFAETNMIGVVTNPPFNLIWVVDVRAAAYGTWNLKAVAVDNVGDRTESLPVSVNYYTGFPTQPVLEITSPGDRALLPSPATFVFSAELLASLGFAAP